MDHQFVLLEGGGGRDGFKISEPLTFYSFLPRPEEKYSISRYLLDLLLLPLLTTTTVIFVSQTLTYLLKGKKGPLALAWDEKMATARDNNVTYVFPPSSSDEKIHPPLN